MAKLPTSTILAIYVELSVSLVKEKADKLPPHRQTDHGIHLDPGRKLPKSRINNLSETELAVIKADLEVDLSKGFMRKLSERKLARFFVQDMEYQCGGTAFLGEDIRSCDRYTAATRVQSFSQ